MNSISRKCVYAFNRALILLSLALLIACTQSARTSINEHDTEASGNFAELKTYRWDFAAMGNAQPDGSHMPEFDRVVCDHVDKIMSEKGYTRIAKGKADFTLDYRITVKQEEAAQTADIQPGTGSEANAYGLRWTFDKGESPSFKGLQAPKDQTVIYRQGELHLAAFNGQNQIIWHSSATRIINGRANEAERRAALRIVIEKIMKTFPVE